MEQGPQVSVCVYCLPDDNLVKRLSGFRHGMICNPVYNHAFYCAVNVLLAFFDFFNIRDFLRKIGLDLNVNAALEDQRREWNT